MSKLDRLARSVPDARAIADELTQRQVKLNIGGSVYDPVPVPLQVHPPPPSAFRDRAIVVLVLICRALVDRRPRQP